MSETTVECGEVIARVISCGLRAASLCSHERVLLRIDAPTAKGIVEKLLAITPPTTLTISVPADNAGAAEAHSLEAIDLGALHVIPFVVDPEIQPGGDPRAWVGSQGFASRLRDYFTDGAGEHPRVLLLFDAAPVETEETTASAELARAVYSRDAFVCWVREDTNFWRLTFSDIGVFELTERVIRSWWRDRSEGAMWRPSDLRKVLHRAADFMASCRTLTRAEEVGERLDRLGLLFRDPQLAAHATSDSSFLGRLDANLLRAATLDAIRRQRAIDPLIDADKRVRLGLDSEPFHIALADALVQSARALPDALRDTDVDYPAVEARWRSGPRVPARIELGTLTAAELDVDNPRPAIIRVLGGKYDEPEEADPSGSSADPDDTEDDVVGEEPVPPADADIVIAARAGRARLALDAGPPASDTSVVFVGGKKAGELTAGAGPLEIDLGTGTKDLEVFEVCVKTGAHQRSGVIQTLRIGIIRGERAVRPLLDDVKLSVDDDGYLIDAEQDEIKLWDGEEEHDIDLTDGEGEGQMIVNVAGLELPLIYDVEAERGSDEEGTGERIRSTPVRILDAIALLAPGIEPASPDSIELVEGVLRAQSGAACGTLKMDPELLEWETALLQDPSAFVGLGQDTESAVADLTPSVGSELESWLSARKLFFDAACEQGKTRAPSSKVCSVYLTDLREPTIESAARAYVESYAAILEALIERKAGKVQVRPILLCDRAQQDGDSHVQIAPTHPLAVALLAAVQRGVLPGPVETDDARRAIADLLDRPLLRHVVPWVKLGDQVLEAGVRRSKDKASPNPSPLLWRFYGARSDRDIDIDAELEGVIVAKVKRLFELAPQLNDPRQWVFINLDLPRGGGDYLLRALVSLLSDPKVRSRFDVGLCGDARRENALADLFRGAPRDDEAVRRRELFQPRIRVRCLKLIHGREAHLAFRLVDKSKSTPFTSVPTSDPLVRDTGFAAGLAEEPLRVARSHAAAIEYQTYVRCDAAANATTSPPPNEGLWDGPWRQLFRRVKSLSQRLAVALDTQAGSQGTLARGLEQSVGQDAEKEYEKAFISVHCDPAQGPEFFLGSRAKKAAVFLVECTDRGRPTLPGRDVVTVTPRMTPFSAALRHALDGLPEELLGPPDKRTDISAALLQDLNALRGSRVFDFLRESARADHRRILDPFDNVMAMRLLLSPDGRLDDRLPVVLALRDVSTRSGFKFPKTGKRCDDILVVYLPREAEDGIVPLRLRVVEVKFGTPSSAEKTKAAEQVKATRGALDTLLPSAAWCEVDDPALLLRARDLAWLIHEALERYRAFEFFHATTFPAASDAWGLKEILARIHRGQIRTQLGAYDEAGKFSAALHGSVVSLEHSLPVPWTTGPSRELEDGVERLRVPRDGVAHLVQHRAPPIAPPSAAGAASGSGSATTTTGGDESPSAGGAEAIEPSPWRTTDPDAENASIEPDPSHNDEAKDDGETPDPEADGGDGGGDDDDDDGGSLPGANGHESADSSEVAEPADTSASAQAELSPAQLQMKQINERLDSVFRGFIGNTGSVGKIRDFLRFAAAKGQPFIQSLGLFGPRSTGKTELARRVAQALKLPIIELSDATLGSADDLASEIVKKAKEKGLGMKPTAGLDGSPRKQAPPMVVFIDEVHLLTKSTQDSLLKSIEPNERNLLASSGAIDTSRLTFLIATTDPGKLGHAFKSRMHEIVLQEYSRDEVVEILRHRRENDDRVEDATLSIDDEGLAVIATMSRHVPRVAIENLKMVGQKAFMGDIEPTAAAIAALFRGYDGCDERGLKPLDRRYLRCLYPDKQKGLQALAAELGEQVVNLLQDVEPFLLQLKLVTWDGGGRRLTELGIQVAHEIKPDLQ